MHSIVWSKKRRNEINKQLKTIGNAQIDRNDSREAFAQKTPPTLKLHNSDLELLTVYLNSNNSNK